MWNLRENLSMGNASGGLVENTAFPFLEINSMDSIFLEEVVVAWLL
jgi:hypothetical protein